MRAPASALTGRLFQQLSCYGAGILLSDQVSQIQNYPSGQECPGRKPRVEQSLLSLLLQPQCHSWTWLSHWGYQVIFSGLCFEQMLLSNYTQHLWDVQYGMSLEEYNITHYLESTRINITEYELRLVYAAQTTARASSFPFFPEQWRDSFPCGLSSLIF